MITLDLARRLQASRVRWSPAAGDLFVVPDREMDAEVFVISDMVVEVREVPSGRILAFNGTTEWALDSVDETSVVWLPREHQLRGLLGGSFISLERVDVAESQDEADDLGPAGYAVTIEVNGARERHIDVDAECAYARALLALASED